jgi:hypothetical protein
MESGAWTTIKKDRPRRESGRAQGMMKDRGVKTGRKISNKIKNYNIFDDIDKCFCGKEKLVFRIKMY